MSDTVRVTVTVPVTVPVTISVVVTVRVTVTVTMKAKVTVTVAIETALQPQEDKMTLWYRSGDCSSNGVGHCYGSSYGVGLGDA